MGDSYCSGMVVNFSHQKQLMYCLIIFLINHFWYNFLTSKCLQMPPKSCPFSRQDGNGFTCFWARNYINFFWHFRVTLYLIRDIFPSLVQGQLVNLSASSLYVPDFSSMRYLNYGAAVSEASLLTHLYVFIAAFCSTSSVQLKL